MTHKEELSLIHIPAENLDIQVSVQSWMGVAQIKNKSRQNQPAFDRVVTELKKQFANGNLETNNITSIFYIILGTLMLIFSVVMANIMNGIH